MPKNSDTQSDPQAMSIKSKLERLPQSQSRTNSGENSAATRHVIVHDESGMKLVPVEKERYSKGDSQQENSDQVSKIA